MPAGLWRPRRGKPTWRAVFVAVLLVFFGPVTAVVTSTGTASADSTWSLSRQYTGQPAWLNSVACPSTSVCYAITELPAEVVVTTDGGADWAVAQDISTTYDLGVITCASVSDCLAVGATDDSGDGDAVVIATTDGWAQWTSQVVPSGLEGLGAVTCATTQICWAIGMTTAGKPAIIATTNGGGTWSEQTVPSAAGSLTGIACTSASSCIAVGAEADGYSSVALILSTTDGGADWAVEPASALGSNPPDLFAVTCYDQDCWAGGGPPEPWENEPVVLASQDGGASWQAQSGPPGGDSGFEIISVSCSSAVDCVAVGGLDSQSSLIMYTTNGGTTWSEGNQPSVSVAAGLDAVSCPALGTCLAVGEGGTGNVYIASTDEGADWSTLAGPPSTTVAGETCATASQCWVYGSNSWGTARFDETLNAGSSWSSATGTLPAGTTDVSGMLCWSASGCYLSTNDAVLVTVDAGQTWVDSPMSTLPSACTSEDDCWAVNSSASVNATTDGGLTWEQYAVGPVAGMDIYIYSIACTSSEDCWAVGSEQDNDQSGTPQSIVEASTDGGQQWSVQEQGEPDVPSLDTVDCPGAGVCMAGLPNWGPDLLVTFNGGQSWSVYEVAGSGASMLDFSCPTTTTCWVSSVPGSAVSIPPIWQVSVGPDGSSSTDEQLPDDVGWVSGIDCAPGTSTCIASGTNPQADIDIFISTSGGGTTSTTTTTASTTTTTVPTTTSSTSATTSSTAGTSTSTTTTTAAPGGGGDSVSPSPVPGTTSTTTTTPPVPAVTSTTHPASTTTTVRKTTTTTVATKRKKGGKPKPSVGILTTATKPGGKDKLLPIDLSCSGASCRGTVEVARSTVVRTGHGVVAGEEVLGKSTFRLGAGHNGTVTLSPASASVLALLAGATTAHPLKATVSVSVDGGSKVKGALTIA